MDNRNTIEQVTVDDPAAGDWTIEVSGANVPSGPQTYYLTYEFLGDELHMGFPLKDHRFVPGTAYHLKWDSYGGSGTFDLDYQLDGGGWVSIATGSERQPAAPISGPRLRRVPASTPSNSGCSAGR